MKRRMQASILESTLRHSVGAGPLAYASLLDCCVGMWRREGLRSFYKVGAPLRRRLRAASWSRLRRLTRCCSRRAWCRRC